MNWKEKWGQYEKKHPKAAKWIYQIFYFWVFSMGVTILQYLMFTFFPYLFGIGLAGTEFMWPRIPMHIAGIDYNWNILGYEVMRNAAGEVVIGGGLGYFISYELGTFLAQCIKLDKFSKHFFREIFSGKVFFHWNLLRNVSIAIT